MALVVGEIKPGFLADSTANVTLIPLPPQNNGAVGWGHVYLSFGSDFGDVVLRVAIYNSRLHDWRVTDALQVPILSDRVLVPIQDGDQKASVGRVRVSPSDTGVFPVGYMIEATLKAV